MFNDYTTNKTLVQEVKHFLRNKRFCNTKRLRNTFGITGQLAGRILRELGWSKYGTGSNSASYKRR